MRQAADEIAVAAPVAVAVQALVDQPLMQLVAAVAAPGAELVMKHLRRTLEAAQDRGVEVEVLAERVSHDERALSLTYRVLRASAETVDAPQKLVALGRVLAYGLDDDARFDTAVLLSAALVDLERVHLRALGRFARAVEHNDPPPPVTVADVDQAKVERDLQQIEDYAGGSLLARSFLAVATRHSLVTERVQSNYGGNVSYYRVGELGLQLLDLLRGVDLDGTPTP